MHTLRKFLGEWAEAVVILGFLAAIITLCGTVENLPLDEWLSQ